MRISSVFAASLVFLASLLSLAQSSQRHLTVIVEDPAGAPIPDAWVQVQHWAATDGKPRMVQDAATATMPKAERALMSFRTSARCLLPPMHLCQPWQPSEPTEEIPHIPSGSRYAQAAEWK
jgi:hypothetical protein